MSFRTISVFLVCFAVFGALGPDSFRSIVLCCGAEFQQLCLAGAHSYLILALLVTMNLPLSS